MDELSKSLHGICYGMIIVSSIIIMESAHRDRGRIFRLCLWFSV